MIKFSVTKGYKCWLYEISDEINRVGTFEKDVIFYQDEHKIVFNLDKLEEILREARKILIRRQND